MRTLRQITAGIALTALLPAVGAAQQSSRLFDNSWFWGAKVGIMSYSTVGSGSSTAPTLGAEWLITRHKGALYLAADQAFFTATSSVMDSQGNSYAVGIKNMRRFTAALLAFPKAFGTVRPYGGIGLAINLIGDANLTDPNVDPNVAPALQQEISDQKDRAAFLTMVGVQAQYNRVSLFGQGTYMASKANFLLNGRATYFLEAGIRYNFGSSEASQQQ